MVIAAALELEAEGVPIILRHARPGRTQHCPRGHDLAVFGAPRFKTKADGTKVKNGRQCRECTRLRQRKGWSG